FHFILKITPSLGVSSFDGVPFETLRRTHTLQVDPVRSVNQVLVSTFEVILILIVLKLRPVRVEYSRRSRCRIRFLELVEVSYSLDGEDNIFPTKPLEDDVIAIGSTELTAFKFHTLSSSFAVDNHF